ncbi:hypothetical protein FXB40_36485 [Bradyrhizobium rifense]|uniref:Uncharacterized protein n=1 Tax=Bradyrhizobium rifense TaxID=515499 RepID=A0A5D3K9Z2_9BRAD|nr:MULTISPECIES: hypothetical protein [Bradyrhizobium]MDH2401344.1 hypothetical protein [Bradyrhizobium sp. SSUT18]TYL89101.1 hypothetical protein FXB40_36485 [Bradyrhizobium rifense]
MRPNFYNSDSKCAQGFCGKPVKNINAAYFAAFPNAIYRVRAWTNDPGRKPWYFHVEITLRTGDTICCNSADLCSKIWSGGGGSPRERFKAAIRAVITDVNFRPPALSGA